MTVFKAYLKVLNKCKMTVILYTAILIFFAGFQMNANDSSTDFVESKPDLVIVNEDESSDLAKNLSDYLKKHCNIKEIDDSEEALDDALFYREVNYIVYIPKNYGEDFLNGKNPKIQVKSTGDYQSSYAEMLVEKYVKTVNLCRTQLSGSKDIIYAVNNMLDTETKVEVTSKLDTTSLSKASYFFSFANYSLLAGCVFVICLVLASFREEKISNRIMISSMNYKKHNFLLLISNATFAITLWAFYVVASFVLVGDIMYTKHGAVLILNSFLFTICCLTIALVIGSAVKKKEALNGIVNVLALGSSFLCGAFIPMEWLPAGVLKVAHILPSYWYIKSNELIKTMEVINLKTLKPIFINMGVICGFTVLFIILFNFVTKKTAKK